MDKKYQGLLLRLEKESQNFVDLSPLERMQSEVASARDVLSDLEAFTLEDGFESEALEIEFFKYVKPRFLSLLIFAVEKYGVERNRPHRRGKSMAKFYRDQLVYIDRFFHQNEFIYQYFKLGGTELDSLYFIRGVQPAGIIGADMPVLDPLFSTFGDYLFSKFIALEKLRDLLVAEMEVPALAGLGLVRSRKGRELRWTGDSCNLIELIYGVFDCRQVNDGEVDLSDLMDVFEQCFQVNLSRYFRRFTEIKRRKSISKTKFLDQMAKAVNKRIEDGDAYVPMAMRG